MKQNPKLSIIVPIYNVEKYLDQCIQSLFRQTLRNIEIILVDDESPDTCPQMCDDYARKDDRVKVVHKKNGGLGYARNSGLAVAQGEYITFLDSDDYVDDNAYEILCSLADENQLDMLRFKCNRFRDNGEASVARYDAPFSVYSSKEEIRKIALYLFDSTDRYLSNDKIPTGGSSCMAIYRGAIINKYNIRFVSEREYISEDYIFNFQFYQQSCKIGYLPNSYYHYRVNPYSLTRGLQLDKIHKAEIYTNYIISLILGNGYDEKNTVFAFNYYLGMARGVTKNVFVSNLSLLEKRKWFLKQMSDAYFQEVSAKYPISILPWKQRLCQWGMKHQLFFFCYFTIIIFDKIRRNQYK